MARQVQTDYPDDIEVGTRADDGRLTPNALYVSLHANKRDMRVLSSNQALKLAAALLETVSELPAD